MRKSWADLEAERLALPRPPSRAAVARRAGLSESTLAKGIANNRSPQKDVRQRIELVLDAERKMQEAGQ